MRFVSNWRAVLTRAWSVRFMILAAMLSGVEVAIPFLDGYLPIPQRTFAALAAISATLAFVARFVVQSGIPPKEDK